MIRRAAVVLALVLLPVCAAAPANAADVVTTYDFTGAALPAGWVTYGSPTLTYGGTGMTITVGATAKGVKLAAAAPASDFTFEAEIAAHTGTYNMTGPMVMTTAGNGVGGTWYASPAGALVAKFTGNAYASNYANAGGTVSYPSTLRIRKSGDNFFSSYKIGAGSWSSESSALAYAGLTITDLGIGTWYYAGTETIRITKAVLTYAGSTGGSSTVVAELTDDDRAMILAGICCLVMLSAVRTVNGFGHG